jgi:hypothetical protein
LHINKISRHYSAANLHFNCVHYLQEEQTLWSYSHTAFGCTYTHFTETNCGALHLTFCALSVGRREGSKQQSYYMLLSVHCLHWEKQSGNCSYSSFCCLCTVFTEKKSGNCSYSPFGSLCTVFPEKNSQETAVILHLAVCALSSLRKTIRKLRFFSIWLSVHCLYCDELTKSRVYPPFDCLFTVFTEKNRHEAAANSQLALCALSWRRTVYIKQNSRFILLCVVSLRQGDIPVGIIFVISISCIMYRALTYQKNFISSACVL